MDRNLILRLKQATDGSIGVLMALFLSLCVCVSAFAVDVGALYLERRTVQSAADLAALAAASDIDRAEAAARATLAANGLDAVRRLEIVKGHYVADPALARGSRFVAGQQPFNAVRLDARLAGRLYFAKSFVSEPELVVSSLGTTNATATFSIGSRLASVNGGVANAVLGALLGGNVSLSAMDYRSLLDANISLASFLSAIATEVGVTAGSYSDVLAAHATVGHVLRAAAHAANTSGQSTAATLLTRLAQNSSSATMSLSKLVDPGPLGSVEVGQAQSALDSPVNVMSLVSAAASLANGARQVQVDLGATLPGLLSLKLDLAIGEAAQHSGWVAVGQPGATVRTAQTRLRLVAEVGGSGVLAGTRVRLPLYLEVASAEAVLKSVTCAAASPSAVVAATPAVIRAWIGDVPSTGLTSFSSSVAVAPGTLVRTPLLGVTGAAYAAMTNVRAVDLGFSQSEVDAKVVKTAEVRDYAQSLVASLLQSVDLRVDIAGLGVGLGSAASLRALVASLLTPVASQLDGVLRPLLDMLGVNLGEVDVGVNGIRCGGAVLAG